MSFWYRFWYGIVYFPAKFLYPCHYYGRENIPTGAAIVCANHTSFLDPVHVACAFGRHHQLFFMAKSELFDIAVVGSILRSGGVFPVKRGEPDIQSVRTTMAHLKNNEKVMLFPEGTRVSSSDAVEAKNGAVRIATKMKVPIVPIFISGKKRLFRFTTLVIGKPFELEAPKGHNYDPLSEKLMEEIWTLEQNY